MNVFLGPIEPGLWAIDFKTRELNFSFFKTKHIITGLLPEKYLKTAFIFGGLERGSVWKEWSIIVGHAEMGSLLTYSYLSDRHSGRWIICQQKCFNLTKNLQWNISYSLCALISFGCFLAISCESSTGAMCHHFQVSYVHKKRRAA